ncbi:hypothetical protein LINPERHAP1_LOCUS7055 [Linum perenne]
MRIRVCMDVTLALKKERKVRRPGGEWLMAKFRYEKLPTFCYVCGRIGHIERHCDIFYRTPEADLVRNWDATLRAEYVKPSLLGGEQFLVPMRKASDGDAEDVGRKPLGALQVNVPMMNRPAPNVTSLMGNLGARAKGWEEDDVGGVGLEDMETEGIELLEDRKRRRGGSDGNWRDVSGGSSRSNTEGVNVPKNVEKTGPVSGTCPPQ